MYVWERMELIIILSKTAPSYLAIEMLKVKFGNVFSQLQAANVVP